MIIIQTLGWITLFVLVGLAVGHATGRVKFGVKHVGSDDKDSD